MSTVAPVATNPEGQAPLSEGQRIIGTFISPYVTLADIKRNASWWAPWILISVVSLLFVFAVDKKIGWDQVVENKLASMSDKQKEKLEQAPPAQRDQQVKGMRIGYQYISYAIPVVLLIIFAVVAAVFMGTFNFGLGAEVTYKQSFAVVMYGALPTIIRGILAAIVVFAIANPQEFNFENAVATNPGFLVSESSNPVLYRFLASLDVFSIWQYIVTGLGFAAISKVKKSTAVGVTLGWYFVIVLFRMGFSAIVG